MSTLFSGINLALQAMLAQQQSVLVTEHNVAQANTPGYRRQEAKLASNPAYAPPGMNRPGGAGQLGMGVSVERIYRFNLEFFDQRFRKELAGAKQWGSYEAALQQMEASLAETSDDGVNARLDAFWEGWQALSAEPTNTAARADLRQRSVMLTDSLNRRAEALIQLRSDQNAAVVQSVSEINDLAERVAKLNGEISQSLAAGAQPNDLLDERDRLIDNLAEMAGAISSRQENGDEIVSIGGHALVVGKESFALQTSPDPANSNLAAITWSDGSGLNGNNGSLYGLLNARDTAIPNQQSGLDTLAATLMNQVNTLHQGGYGLNGATGLDFFTGSDALSVRVNPVTEDLASIAAAANPNAAGDGSVAGQMAGLQHLKLLNGGASTMNQFAADQASSLGLDVAQASKQVANHELLTSSLAEQRESLTGVSLDEEAANLIKFQRTYQAAARLINVLDEMMETVINGMGVVGR